MDTAEAHHVINLMLHWLADVRLHFVSNELLMPIRLMVVLALRHQNNLDEAKAAVTASVLCP